METRDWRLTWLLETGFGDWRLVCKLKAGDCICSLATWDCVWRLETNLETGDYFETGYYLETNLGTGDYLETGDYPGDWILLED